MSTTYKPFGLKPVYHPSGLDRATAFVGTNTYNPGTTFSAPYGIIAGQAFYQYQPVAINASGQLVIAETLAANGRVYGVFDGVEFTDSQGRRSVAKGATYETLAASTQIVFWLWTDPVIVFEAQSTGSVTTAMLGRQFNFDATAGYTPASGTAIGSGGAFFSTTGLAASPVATGAQGQVRVVGLGREVAYPSGENNAWGDAKTIVQVQIANHQFVYPTVLI